MVSDVISDAIESINEYKESMPRIYNSGGLIQEHVDNLLLHMEDVLRFLDSYHPKTEKPPVVGKYNK